MGPFMRQQAALLSMMVQALVALALALTAELDRSGQSAVLVMGLLGLLLLFLVQLAHSHERRQ